MISVQILLIFSISLIKHGSAKPEPKSAHLQPYRGCQRPRSGRTGGQRATPKRPYGEAALLVAVVFRVVAGLLARVFIGKLDAVAGVHGQRLLRVEPPRLVPAVTTRRPRQRIVLKKNKNVGACQGWGRTLGSGCRATQAAVQHCGWSFPVVIMVDGSA